MTVTPEKHKLGMRNEVELGTSKRCLKESRERRQIERRKQRALQKKKKKRRRRSDREEGRGERISMPGRIIDML